jgi:pilus assembly protein CpaE
MIIKEHVEECVLTNRNGKAKPHMPNCILAVDDDEMTLRLVGATLSKAGYEVVTAHNGQEAFQRISENRPSLVVLDVMMPDITGFEVCTRLRSTPATAHLPVIMLTALTTVEQKIKGFEAGADDYLPKPFVPDELLMRVRVLLRHSTSFASAEVESVNGKIISVFSLRGGIGVSSLAANLATGLSQIWDKPAVLVDLVLTAGQDALMLNLPFHHSWEDVATLPVSELDDEYINQILLLYPNGTRLLAASPNPETGEQLLAENVAHVITTIKKRYHHSVLDLSHDFSESNLTGLDISDTILCVVAPELASVHAMNIALKTFEKLSIPSEKIELVLNCTFQRNGLSRKDIENTFHRPVKYVVPFAPDPMITAINMGTPVVISQPESPLGMFLEDLAFLVSKKEFKNQRPKEPSKAWLRVYSRLKQRSLHKEESQRR